VWDVGSNFRVDGKSLMSQEPTKKEPTLTKPQDIGSTISLFAPVKILLRKVMLALFIHLFTRPGMAARPLSMGLDNPYCVLSWAWLGLLSCADGCDLNPLTGGPV
jgi:hypothetical protein